MIFLGEFLHCGYKLFLKKLGMYLFISVNSRKKKRKNGKNRQKQITKLEKKKERKSGTGLYICVHSK